MPTRQADKFHLTGKPTALMVDLVAMCSPGGRVLDPFAGSGTTLVAAALTGRGGVGIEREESYCEKAAERVERAIKAGTAEAAAVLPEFDDCQAAA